MTYNLIDGILSFNILISGPKFDPGDAKSCPMIGKWSADGMSIKFLMIKSALLEEKMVCTQTIILCKLTYSVNVHGYF